MELQNIVFKMFESPQILILVVLRVSGFVVASPVFGRFNIPNRIKAGFSLFLGYLIFVSFNFSINLEELNLLQFMMLCINEVIIGLVIGFVAVLFFSIFAIAGQVMDMQVSFRMDTLTDPSTKQRMPLIGNLLTAMAFLVFFELDGHLRMIRLLYESYYAIPLLEGRVDQSIVGIINTAFFMAYEIATKIAMPLIVIMLVTEFVLGIIVKFVPQMNVFVVGIPLRILVGLITLFFLVGPFVYLLDGIFDRMYNYTTQIILAMRG